MNYLLVPAAVLALAIGAAHSWLGEKYILIRLFRRTNLPHLRGSDVFTKRTIRFAWHITSVAWWGFAVLLFQYAMEKADYSARAAVTTIALTFFVTSLMILVGSRGRHFAWVVFLAIAALAWFGTP